MDIQAEKQRVRDSFSQDAALTLHPGKIAQNLRALPCYRQASQIFVTPSPVLSQVRINALLDGKDLIMPAAGLKEGFFLCRPYSVPFPDLSQAVTLRGIGKFGKRLILAELADLSVELLVTDAVAVDAAGTRLGDGQGFFDLTHAILAEVGGLSDSKQVYAVLAEQQLSEVALPVDSWDVPMDGIITATGSKECPHAPLPAPSILWEVLGPDRIRKISPLWQLSNLR